MTDAVRDTESKAEITGAEKVQIAKITESANVILHKKKGAFSCNREVCLLTKGLLMGDPFLPQGNATAAKSIGKMQGATGSEPGPPCGHGAAPGGAFYVDSW